MERVRARRRGARASTSSSGSCATSATEWAGYKTQVTPFELDRYLPEPVRRGETVMEPLLVFPGPAAAASWPRRSTCAGYPWKAARRRRLAASHRARGRLGRGGRRAPTATPRTAFAFCRTRCASATSRSSRCCCSSPAPSSATSSCATTCSTTSASRPFQPPRARGPPASTCSGAGRRHPARAGRVRRAGAQPRDLPGRHRRPAARPHLHGVRAAQVPRPAPGQGVHPRDRCSPGCGATSTTAAPARSTSTSGASGPSSARSTPA